MHPETKRSRAVRSCRWRFESPRTLGRRFLFDGVQPGAVLFLHLFRRNYSAAKVCELHELMLDCLKPFISLSVGDLNSCSIPAVTPKLLIQCLYLSDLRSETPNFVPKNP